MEVNLPYCRSIAFPEQYDVKIIFSSGRVELYVRSPCAPTVVLFPSAGQIMEVSKCPWNFPLT